MTKCLPIKTVYISFAYTFADITVANTYHQIVHIFCHYILSPLLFSCFMCVCGMKLTTFYWRQVNVFLGVQPVYLMCCTVFQLGYFFFHFRHFETLFFCGNAENEKFGYIGKTKQFQPRNTTLQMNSVSLACTINTIAIYKHMDYGKNCCSFFIWIRRKKKEVKRKNEWRAEKRLRFQSRDRNGKSITRRKMVETIKIEANQCKGEWMCEICEFYCATTELI